MENIVRRVHRALKPNGQFIVVEPFHDSFLSRVLHLTVVTTWNCSNAPVSELTSDANFTSGPFGYHYVSSIGLDGLRNRRITRGRRCLFAEVRSSGLVIIRAFRRRKCFEMRSYLTESAVNVSPSRDASVERTISVVVPTYKSAAYIGKLVRGLLDTFNRLGEKCEIVLVDDCSPDTTTWPALTKLYEQYGPTLKIIRLLKNSGQHNAILCGLESASGEVIITMDDDLQHPPEEIPKLLQKLDEGYDLVIGAYDEKQHEGYRNLGGEIVDALIRRIYRLPRTLKLTSFRAMTKSLVEVARKSQNPYPYVTCILLDQASRVTNVPVYTPRGNTARRIIPFGEARSWR